jgi:hypothetical protein
MWCLFLSERRTQGREATAENYFPKGQKKIIFPKSFSRMETGLESPLPGIHRLPRL